MAEISFFLAVAGANFRGRVRSSDIQRDLRGEPLLLLVERSWMKRIEALVRMSPLDVFSACVTETRSGGKPISCLVWEQLGIPQEELEILACCRCDPTSGDKWKDNGWIDI